MLRVTFLPWYSADCFSTKLLSESVSLQILSAKWITISGCARKKGRRHEEHEKKKEVNAYFGYYSYYFNRIPSLEPRISRRQRAPGGPRSSRARTASAAGRPAPRCAEKAPDWGRPLRFQGRYYHHMMKIKGVAFWQFFRKFAALSRELSYTLNSLLHTVFSTSLS